MSLGTLTIDLAANVAGLESDLGKAQRVFDKNARDFQRTAAGIAKVTAGVSAAVAVGFAAMVKSSIDTADQLSKQSSIVGIAIEDLSVLKHAAELSGVSFDQLGAGLNKFNKQVDDAFAGVGTGADAFEALGISVKNADGSLKDNYVLISEVAEVLSQVEDGAQKSAIAQDLFGKSGAKLIPLLNGGKRGLQDVSEEARRLGLIFNGETGKAAEEFNDNLDRLQKTFTGLANRAAGELAPSLADVTRVFADPKTQEGISVFSKWLGVVIGQIAELTAATFSLYGSLSKNVGQAINGIDTKNIEDVRDRISEIKGLLASPIISGLTDPFAVIKSFGMSKEELAAEKKSLEEILRLQERAALSSAGKALGGGAKKSGPTLEVVDPEVEARAKSLQQAFDGQVDAYRRQIALAGEVTELERVRYEYSQGSLVGINEKQKVILDNLAIEKDRKAVETKLLADLESARSNLLTQEESIIKAAEERARVLAEAYRAGKIGEEEFGELMRKNGELARKEMDELKNKTTELSEFTKELYRGVQDSIADALVTGIKGGSENALEAFRDLLIRMAAEAAAADITRWIFGSGQTTGGGGSGSGANTVGIISSIAGLFGGGLAVGGPAYAGKMYEVGENNNPELFRANGRQYMIPGNGGSVIPASGGGGNVIHINMPGVTNAREARESAGAVARKVSAAVSASQRYN